MDFYLDYAATHPVETRFILNQILKEERMNPSSTHSLGIESKNAYDKSIKNICNRLGVSEITITSGATEANNLAVKIGVQYCKESKEFTGIACSDFEHPSLHNSIHEYSKDTVLYEYYFNSDMFFGKDWKKRLRKTLQIYHIGFLSVMTVNNETGVRYPVEEIYKICKSLGVLFHTDASQSWLKLNFYDEKLFMATISGHKIGTTIGEGLLIGGKNVCKRTPSILVGGNQQELRSGTLNYLAARELEYAIVMGTYKKASNLKFVEEYRNKFITLIKKYGGEIITQENCQNYSPCIICFYFKDYDGEFIQKFFSKNNVYISAGSACSRGNQEGSRVIKNMGYSEEISKNVLRVSFSPYMGIELLKEVYIAFKEVLKKLNELS